MLAKKLSGYGLGMLLLCSNWALADLNTPAKTPVSQTVPNVELNSACQTQADSGPEMVLIAVGSFQMGSADTQAVHNSDESPRHAVTIAKPFALARCEVTVAEFRRFIEATTYITEAERSGGCYTWDAKNLKKQQNPLTSWRYPGFDQTDKHPVACVSWQDAKAYIRWLNQDLGLAMDTYRLPSEAEWEYAARAGSQTAYFWHSASQCDYANGADLTLKNDGDDTKWTYADCKDGFSYTAPVASFKANVWGLYDLSGNVWEWVEDCWHDNYQGAPNDGSAWLAGTCDQRSVRGGAWDFNPSGLHSAIRSWYRPDDTDIDVGFRLARTL